MSLRVETLCPRIFTSSGSVTGAFAFIEEVSLYAGFITAIFAFENLITDSTQVNVQW